MTGDRPRTASESEQRGTNRKAPTGSHAPCRVGHSHGRASLRSRHLLPFSSVSRRERPEAPRTPQSPSPPTSVTPPMATSAGGGHPTLPHTWRGLEGWLPGADTPVGPHGSVCRECSTTGAAQHTPVGQRGAVTLQGTGGRESYETTRSPPGGHEGGMCAPLQSHAHDPSPLDREPLGDPPATVPVAGLS